MASARIEQTLERFQEDERLTSDLPDPAATALLGWIDQQVRAADAIGDQQGFERQVAAIRSAARAAASTRSLDPTADSVVAQAQAALEASAPSSTDPAASASSAASVPAAPAATAAAEQPMADVVRQPAAASDARPGSSTSVWRALRRRMRRWTHRKAS